MKKKTEKTTPFSGRKWLYRTIAAICLVLIMIPIGTVMAKYITGYRTSAMITPALFYTDGQYVEKIESGSETIPRIKASGWKDGIVLELYNYEDDEKISEIALGYTITLPEGWDYKTEQETLPANIKSSTVITLIAPKTAKKGDVIQFELQTGPYAVMMKAEFELSDAHIPDWKLEDKGAYTLLTIYTNDYEGAVTVKYDATIFAADSTNHMTAAWSRNGEGVLTSDSLQRFTTYELIFFEEVQGEYTFSPAEGKGSEIPIKITPST